MSVAGKRCQLCGKVTGIWREDAAGLFEAGALVLERKGAETVWNPMEQVPPDCDHDRAMRMCIRRLITYTDVLVTLPGWEMSEGACLEVAVARAVGVPVVGIGDVV